MDTLISLGQFAICAAVIVVAGTVLANCADAIAEITKLGRLLVGSILLAGATSLPELTVDISAIRIGAPDLAVGDLFGSCLANLLILAMLDLMRHSNGHLLSRRAARHALSGSMSVALTAIAGVAMLTAPFTGQIEVLGISPGLLLLALTYIGGARILYYDQRVSAKVAEIEQAMESQAIHEPTEPPKSLKRAILGFSTAAAVILVIGPFMSHAAEQFAAATGLGRSFVGTTLVALSTSLPEFVSTLAAVRLGAFDLAIGNIFGSNAFNMLLLVPLDVVQKGSLMAAISSSHAITCLASILATQAAIVGQLYNVEARRRFLDPDAWLVIAVVFSGLALVYYTQ